MSEFTPFHRGGSGSPLVLLHGFTGTWHIWEPVIGEPVIAALEAEHDVFVPTLPAHAGGPELTGEPSLRAVVDGIETLMDEQGFETAHIVGNSLGGYVTMDLAARGRARSAVAIAPAGGWAVGDPGLDETMDLFQEMDRQIRVAAPNVDALVRTPEGRARTVQFLTEHPEVMSPEQVTRIVLAAARCTDAVELAETGGGEDWSIDAAQIERPVRFIWGTSDRILTWPTAAVRYRESFPHVDWVLLDGVGHCPQVDVPIETAQLILDFTRP